MSNPPSRMHIARVERDDEALVMELARLAHAESVFSDFPFSEKKFSMFFARGFKEPDRYIVLKAEVGERIVGFLHCTLGDYFIAEGGLIASVHSVYVQDNLRLTLLGGKIALRLIRATTKWAQAQKAKMVLFYVTSGIHVAGADAFFRKMGMTTLGGNYAIKV